MPSTRPRPNRWGVVRKAVTSASGPATLDTSFPILPGWSGYSLLIQHATLDPVPGGLSLSDAVAVQFGF